MLVLLNEALSALMINWLNFLLQISEVVLAHILGEVGTLFSYTFNLLTF